MEAVAAVGSKYLTRVVGDVKSLGSGVAFPFLEESFLEERPAELVDALRGCRGIV